METENCEILKFVPFKSFVSPTFWHKLAELKIDVDRLNDTPKSIFGYFTNFKAKSCLLEVDYSSFNTDFAAPINNYTAVGTLYNKNTIEDFKECDKVTLLNNEGNKFISDAKDGNILDDPRLLIRFMILSYADLKCHKYYYWFAFPCPLQPIVKIRSDSKVRKLNEINIPNNLLKDNQHLLFFIIKQDESSFDVSKLKDQISVKDSKSNFQNIDLERIYFCFPDPCEFDAPSWVLRVYISFLHITCPKLHGNVINFIGLRSQDDYSDSRVWSVLFPSTEFYPDGPLNFSGWELNQNNKLGARMASMSDSMDPAKLAENSVNLNLKLMKWRLLPDLDLDVIAKQKCLIFGAGTLGCAVARNLLAWGFKTISLIDNGKISFSNPVRQTLYKHEDAINGNKKKATTAALRIQEINPNAIAKGYVLEIPMPGHTVGDSIRDSVIDNLKTIDELVQSHDVLFLLTDSRESRWLPTLLGAAYEKIVINAALGFDSYLVMRHGSRRTGVPCNAVDVGDLKCVPGSQLGCYFCNDVTAPGDSLKDRTLDQQCTVTRPGVSSIAASYAVELLVSLLQHPDKELAPAYFTYKIKAETKMPEGILGIIPHSLRGMLCNYENILPATTKFNQCIACSEPIINSFQSSGNDFLFKVFETAKYLEELTGISDYAELQNEIIECNDSDWSDS